MPRGEASATEYVERMLAFLTTLACTDPLVPGELVIGIDIAEEVSYGSENARLGAAVATDGHSILALAPGIESVWYDGELLNEGAFAVGHTFYLGPWIAGNGVIRFLYTGREFPLLPDDRLVLSDPSGDGYDVLIGGPSGLRELFRGLVLYDGPVEAAAVAEQGLAIRTCDAGVCRILRDGGPQEERFYELPHVPAVAGAALVWNNEEVCGGDPQDEFDDGAGLVKCGNGTHVAGLPGDHLGRVGSVVRGYAAGTFNKWIVPARTRIIPFDGGDVLALERGAEDQATVLAVADDLLIIGQPYEMYDGMTAGAIHQVRP